MATATDPELTGFQLELPYDLGRYRLDAEIGRGGMGIVYHAEDTMLERPVAVKVLLPQLAADGNFVQRFKREAQMAARLEHANIVTVHDVGEVNGLVYFVMRLVTGRPLDRLMEEGLPWVRAENIAVQVADAMAYAHGNGVIHRDIKPENVIVSREGIVTITDFGLARPQASATGPTQAGVVLGTPGYMAPEQALGTDVDHRADIYAFGVMLFELITGDLPFDGETAFAIINQHINTPPPPVTDLKPDTPRWLSELVARLLEKDPARRPASMAEVSEMLQSRQGSVIEAPVVAQGEEDVSAEGVVGRVRRGEIALADAIAKYPDVSATLQEVFRREVTVVSFDLAGSTALKQASGGTVAIGPVFNAYRELVDKCLGEHHCAEAVWAGDGTVALFPTPSDAVAAAQDIVSGLREINGRFPETPNLGVRTGIHTGSVLRDPNQPLGQVTSTVLDMTGHIQKDAKVGLVEVSQATLDKLPSQEGWLRLRTARDGNLTIFGWHPDGPEHVPQSWVQRIRRGVGELAEEAQEVGDKVKTAAAARATAKTTTERKKEAAPKPEQVKLSCPYCEGEVTVVDQKCPHCDRLNRHYDPAIAEKGKRRKTAPLPSARRTAQQSRARTTMAGDAKRRSGVMTQAQLKSQAGKPAQKPEVAPDAIAELVTGVLICVALWVGGAWVLKEYLPRLWWVERGQVMRTSWLGLFLPGAACVLVSMGSKLTQPALAAGIYFGIPLALVALRLLNWWV